MNEQQAIHRIDEFYRAKSAYASWIRAAATLPGSEFLLSRIGSAGAEGQLMDYLAELRYALVFRDLGFTVEIEPLGRKGPDLEVSREGLSAVVEIARFRPMNPGPPESGGELLAEYGNPSRDVAKSLAKIVHKFEQLVGNLSIIAIWNDDDALEELEMSSAVRDLVGSPGTPSSLQFVLFGSCWTSPGRYLNCLPVRDVGTQVRRWIDELEAVSASAADRAAVAALSAKTTDPCGS